MYSKRTYLAIDLKSFYASVECVERGLDPLTTNLVVADELRTEKTICLAVTPSLKAYGLSGRSRLFEVVQKAKEVKRATGKELEYITAVPRMALYIKYSADIYSIYLKYFSPEDIHVYSIDEVFIDATSYLEFYHVSARELVNKVIGDVLKTTGITATAGIATNLFLCKVAMDIVAKNIAADENGVRIAELDEYKFRRTMWEHKPLTDFWRIGPGIAKWLASAGVFCMGDLVRLSVKNEDILYQKFGIDAEILIDHAWGYEPCSIADIKKYHSKSNCISNGQVLHEPYCFKKAKIVVREMAEILAFDLFKKNFVTSSVTLWVGYEKLDLSNGEFNGIAAVDCYGRIIPKPAHGSVNFGTGTNCCAKIVDATVSLFDRIVDSSLMVRRFNISANNVTAKYLQQMELFSETKPETKDAAVHNAMILIQKKFGKNALLKGTSLEDGATTIMRNSQIGGHRA